MTKKLSCWFGRHSWTTQRAQGETYRVCSACGKTPRGTPDLDARAHDHFPQMYDRK